MTEFPCAREQRAKALLKEKGLKSTPQRLAVLHVLHESTGYLSINDILEKTKHLTPRTGLATIYRTLDIFVEIGLATRVHFQSGSSFYVHSDHTHNHQIICTICNKTMDFSECPFEDYLEDLSSRNGFKMHKHLFQIYGECNDCVGDQC